MIGAPLQWANELSWFLDWVQAQSIQHVLEIGTGPGGMTKRLGDVTNGVLVSVDLPASGDATGVSWAAAERRNQNLQIIHERFQGVLGNSHADDTIMKVAKALNGQQVDLLFLDGDDSLAGKVRDYRDYLPFVKHGGWIATHDICSNGCGVPEFWLTLVSGTGRRSLTFVDHVAAHAWGGIGVVLCHAL